MKLNLGREFLSKARKGVSGVSISEIRSPCGFSEAMSKMYHQ